MIRRILPLALLMALPTIARAASYEDELTRAQTALEDALDDAKDQGGKCGEAVTKNLDVAVGQVRNLKTRSRGAESLEQTRIFVSGIAVSAGGSGCSKSIIKAANRAGEALGNAKGSLAGGDQQVPAGRGDDGPPAGASIAKSARVGRFTVDPTIFIQGKPGIEFDLYDAEITGLAGQPIEARLFVKPAGGNWLPPSEYAPGSCSADPCDLFNPLRFNYWTSQLTDPSHKYVADFVLTSQGRPVFSKTFDFVYDPATVKRGPTVAVESIGVSGGTRDGAYTTEFQANGVSVYGMNGQNITASFAVYAKNGSWYPQAANYAPTPCIGDPCTFTAPLNFWFTNDGLRTVATGSDWAGRLTIYDASGRVVGSSELPFTLTLP